MKKIKLILVLFVVLIGTTLSNCQHNDFDELNQEAELLEKKKTTKFIYYQGLKVKHRFKSTEKELKGKKNKKTLKKLFNELRKQARYKSRLLGKSSNMDDVIDDEPYEDVELPNAETVVEAAKVVLPLFPYEEIEDYIILYRPNKEFIDEEMIRGDFSELSDSEIVTNESIVDDYYSENFDYMILEEIANNPTVYDNIGTSHQKSTSGDNLNKAEKLLCFVTEAMDNGYGFARSSFSVFLASERANESRTGSGNTSSYYEFVDESDTRRDAYRHMLWNSLLAQYYFTISSKSGRLCFAEIVANANEEAMCGSPNNIDAREMDYHNNVIGRKIWNDNTGYRTIFGATIGLNRTTTSHLKDLALEKIEKNGLFIVKEHPTNVGFDYNALETQALILQTDIDTPVYFVGPIAPVYETSLVLEYYNCETGNPAPKKNENDIILLGKVPVEDEEEEEYNCTRYITVHTPIYQQYVSNDTNYNPYFRHNTNPFN